MFIKNFKQLAKTPQRKIVLEIIEEGLFAIQPKEIISRNIKLTNANLTIKDKTFTLQNYNRIFLLGFGKGSAMLAKYTEEILGDFLTEGYVIDLEKVQFSKIEQTIGTHPLSSKTNFLFTKKVLKKLTNLSKKDLIIVLIAGGGSALFEDPYKIDLKKTIEVNKALLKSGADINEINTIRKHLSKVKGGGLVKTLYPAKIVSLIFSDVPGNDLSVIASGPTVKDNTTIGEALAIYKKYNLDNLGLLESDFLETLKDDSFLKNVENLLILSNLTVLRAMEEKAKKLGLQVKIYSDKLKGDAKTTGRLLDQNATLDSILLAGGETTVKVTGNGQGGRNQELVLGTLSYLDDKTIIASFDSDGWDNSKFAGAIGDFETVKKAKELNLNPEEFLEKNSSLAFFEKVGDGIETGRLPSNVSDIMIVLKK